METGPKSFRLIQKRWYSSEMTVLEGEGEIGRLSFSLWGSAGAIACNGEDCKVMRQESFSRELRFECGGVAVCKTKIAGMWNQRAELSVDGVRHMVKWPALEMRAILLHEGEEVGTVGPWSGWRMRAEAVFAGSVPLRVCLLVMWLAAYKRQQDNSG